MRGAKEDILGYSVDSSDKKICLQEIAEWAAKSGQSRWLACFNPHSCIEAYRDATFTNALHDADWLVPDGVGIVLASRALGGIIHERITGSDVFWGVSDILNKKGETSYFFLGSTEETLAKIKTKMAIEYPNITFAGSYSPPYKAVFSEEDNRSMIEAVNGAAPDVLWVGMTAPKQEKWLYENIDKLDLKFAGAIGAVFDFYVGNVKRSHPVFQKMGLEWLPRLLQEPRRLFRRNFISSPLFVYRVLKQRVGIE